MRYPNKLAIGEYRGEHVGMYAVVNIKHEHRDAAPYFGSISSWQYAGILLLPLATYA